MDGVLLYRLGRRLQDLARLVTTEASPSPLPAAEVAILGDLLRHPGSTATDIRARTGFVQSHVSASVARLRAKGLITVEPDNLDRRRTRIRLSGLAQEAIYQRASSPAHPVLLQVAGDNARAKELEGLLEELAKLLL